MQIIGFNLTKIQADRKDILSSNLEINTNIEFLDLDKDKLEILKDAETLRLNFRFTIVYLKDKKNEEAKILFEGTILLSSTQEESKELLKDWKKKQVSPNYRIPLFNLILRRCSVRALQLEEELSIPAHIPVPQITQSQIPSKEDKK